MTITEALKAAAKNGFKITLTGLPPIRKTLPKSKMGALVDELHDIRDLRLALTKVADAVKAEEQRITEHIIDSVGVDEGGVVGKAYKAIVVREQKPIVEDWDKFYAYITKHKAFDLLNKAINAGAVKERWEAKKAIAGVGSFQAKKLSVTKV
jgi:hypothetical protein